MSASVYSPAVVADEEELCRYLLNPVHVDDSGQLKPTAVGDSERLGMSTNRLRYTTLERIRTAATERAAGWNAAFPDAAQPRRLVAFVKITAGEARSIFTEGGTRAFCVFDTAMPEDPSHADVFQAAKEKKAARSARAQLRELFNARLATFD
jgi:hypothetical protein